MARRNITFQKGKLGHRSYCITGCPFNIVPMKFTLSAACFVEDIQMGLFYSSLRQRAQEKADRLVSNRSFWVRWGAGAAGRKGSGISMVQCITGAGSVASSRPVIRPRLYQALIAHTMSLRLLRLWVFPSLTKYVKCAVAQTKTHWTNVQTAPELNSHLV